MASAEAGASVVAFRNAASTEFKVSSLSCKVSLSSIGSLLSILSSIGSLLSILSSMSSWGGSSKIWSSWHCASVSSSIGAGVHGGLSVVTLSQPSGACSNGSVCFVSVTESPLSIVWVPASLLVAWVCGSLSLVWVCACLSVVWVSVPLVGGSF